jgi:hypothetical protein
MFEPLTVTFMHVNQSRINWGALVEMLLDSVPLEQSGRDDEFEDVVPEQPVENPARNNTTKPDNFPISTIVAEIGKNFYTSILMRRSKTRLARC